MPNLCLVLIAILAAAALSAVSASPATAGYKVCAPVRVDLGVIDADLAVRNTSCQFGRTFVRTNRATLCRPAKTIRAWRKTFGGVYEDVTLTLVKGNKRIRTGACGS